MHEDASEYRALLTALVDEHQPAAATEAHLVEELAGIIWRKRRVLQAEGANINKGLKGAARDAQGVIPAAAPFEYGLSGEGTDLRDSDAADAGRSRRAPARCPTRPGSNREGCGYLRRGGANAYDKALRALMPDSREWWQEFVEDENEERPATAATPIFIRHHLEPICVRMEKKHGTMRRSKRKPWVKGCKCIDWKSLRATKPILTANSNAPWRCY